MKNSANVRNGTVLLILAVVAVTTTIFVSNGGGSGLLSAKAILLFLPLYLILRSVRGIPADFAELRQSRDSLELVSFLVSLGGIGFWVFCFASLVYYYSIR